MLLGEECYSFFLIKPRLHPWKISHKIQNVLPQNIQTLERFQYRKCNKIKILDGKALHKDWIKAQSGCNLEGMGHGLMGAWEGKLAWQP
jgi:hypothetical protein